MRGRLAARGRQGCAAAPHLLAALVQRRGLLQVRGRAAQVALLLQQRAALGQRLSAPPRLGHQRQRLGEVRERGRGLAQRRARLRAPLPAVAVARHRAHRLAEVLHRGCSTPARQHHPRTVMRHMAVTTLTA